MRLLLAMAACMIPALAWAAEPVPVEIPNGDSKLRALLYKPDGNGPFAVVIGLHGCEGLPKPRRPRAIATGRSA
jgi:poly(3-hydroxybutyrate) depolymerase